jgi:hypothetical protein
LIGVGGSRRKLQQRSSGFRRKSPAEIKAAQRFRAEVVSYGCFFAEHRDDHSCSGPLQAHHLLPGRAIRDEFRGEAEEDLLAALYNPVIGAPLCAHAHHLVEQRREYIWWDELTDACKVFCRGIGMEGRLRLACPEREEIG